MAKRYIGVTGNCTLDEYGDRETYRFGFYGFVEEDGAPNQRLMAIFSSDSRQTTWID